MHDNSIMLEKCIQPIRKEFDRILISILREHEVAYGVTDILKRVLPEAEILVLGEVTRGQAETVKLMLEYFKVKDDFLVKDSDSYFVPEQVYERGKNYVSVCSLRATNVSRLHQKSFAHFNDQQKIIGMTEKVVTSEWFSCGGYFFSDPEEFFEAFSELDNSETNTEMYLAHVIDRMIDNKTIFLPMPVRDYEDLGVFEDWVQYRSRYRTYIFDLDGVILENGSQFISPKWGETKTLPGVKEKMQRLKDSGHYIVIMTSRPEKYRQLTKDQLEREEIIYDQLILGVHHGVRCVINDFSDSNPFPTASAVNSERNTADWIKRI